MCALKAYNGCQAAAKALHEGAGSSGACEWRIDGGRNVGAQGRIISESGMDVLKACNRYQAAAKAPHGSAGSSGKREYEAEVRPTPKPETLQGYLDDKKTPPPLGPP